MLPGVCTRAVRFQQARTVTAACSQLALRRVLFVVPPAASMLFFCVVLPAAHSVSEVVACGGHNVVAGSQSFCGASPAAGVCFQRALPAAHSRGLRLRRAQRCRVRRAQRCRVPRAVRVQVSLSQFLWSSPAAGGVVLPTAQRVFAGFAYGERSVAVCDGRNVAMCGRLADAGKLSQLLWGFGCSVVEFSPVARNKIVVHVGPAGIGQRA